MTAHLLNRTEPPRMRLLATAGGPRRCSSSCVCAPATRAEGRPTVQLAAGMYHTAGS